jgi:flagellar hook protein FlgE
MKIDASGNITNLEGMQLQGYKALGNNQFAASVSGLQVNTAALSPKPTAKMAVTANLDSNASILANQTPPVTWDLTKPGQTSNFSTSMQVYDSLGNAHAVDVYFVKTASNAWDYHAVVDGGQLAGGTAGTNVEIGAGSISFGADGSLSTVTTSTAISANFNGANPNQAITLDFGTPSSVSGTGLTGTTQFASPSSVSNQSQDGYASGDLAGISVDGNGVVKGTYTNGQKLDVGQLAVAKFRSNEGLGRAGHNLWIATRESGDAALGTAGSGGRGAVTGGALEQSNVDLATQFVDLIAHQRAFSANSKTITTADEMLQEVVNLKR